MKQLFRYFIPLLFLGLIFGIIFYLSDRFAGYFPMQYPWLWYVVITALVIFSMMGVMRLVNRTTWVAHYLFISASFMMGFILYLTLSVLLLDVTKFFWICPPHWLGLLALGMTTIICLYGMYRASDTKFKHFIILIEGLTKDLILVHLSDIHIGHFRNPAFLEKIIAKTNQQNPNLVVITGDYLDAKIALKEQNFLPLNKLNAPVFFVAGNHDEYTDVSEIIGKLQQAKVKVLQNEVTHFEELQIVGLNYMVADTETFDIHANNPKQTIKSVLSELVINPNQPSLLLHHGPYGIQYAHKKGIDLYLTGHTHAGQLFPITWIAHRMFPYNRGLHTYKGTRIVVSEGIGTFGPPMRIGTQSEIVVIKLKAPNHS